jgi:crossover junction endodeoxyribonuclease RusA
VYAADEPGEFILMLTIVLPWPDSRVSPNARTHWAPKSKIKAQERQAAKIIALSSGYESLGDGDIPLSIEFCPPDLRHRDRDNCLASCKAMLDGVADALNINDSRFEPITLRRGAVVKGGQVIVRIGE